MKSLFSFIAVALLLLVGAASASAQAPQPAMTASVLAPYIDASIQGTHNSGNFGFTGPQYTYGGGIESNTRHLFLDVNVLENTADPNNFSGGYTTTVTGSGYLKFGGVLAGGGAFYSNAVALGENFASAIKFPGDRDQVRPFVGGGYQFRRDRIILNYVLPGKDKVAGFSNIGDRTLQLRNEFTLGNSGFASHLRATQNVDFSSNRLSESGARQENYTAGVGIKFVF
jgi:hypothetical protein